jgi:hypothetical protein
VIPFCAYNVLYREGHVVLPALRDAGALHAPAGRGVDGGRPPAAVPTAEGPR